jgi:hypothetical protein
MPIGHTHRNRLEHSSKLGARRELWRVERPSPTRRYVLRGDDVAAEGETGSPGSGGASPKHPPFTFTYTDTDTDTDSEKIYKTFLILG